MSRPFYMMESWSKDQKKAKSLLYNLTEHDYLVIYFFVGDGKRFLDDTPFFASTFETLPWESD